MPASRRRRRRRSTVYRSSSSLSEQDLGSDFNRLSRLRMLARIAEGNLPDVPSPVQLVPEERCHWVVQCTLADRISMPQTVRRELAGCRLHGPRCGTVRGHGAA
jgi:hypothetical protein